MFDEQTFESGDNCAVFHPVLKRETASNNKRLIPDKLEEAKGLALAINLNVKICEAINLSHVRPATFIGSGKVDEMKAELKANDVTLVIIDTSLSPIQQRNLEKAWDCKVIDRTALILEIFGERARTKEGRLQVDLAALEYQKGRLVRSWTHLERQRGALGFVGGPGETQIESDRRMIGDRILKIKRQLETVVRTRELHRKSRRKTPYPIVALVGYTNAGKSTLFNRLTGANVIAKDKLFATLDPAMRAIKLPSGQIIILSDTVGFVSDLPTELIAAFRATLEEVVEADLILHVRDISHDDTDAQKQDVYSVLRNLDLEEKLSNDTIEIYNKIDLLDSDEAAATLAEAKRSDNCIAISAMKGDGCDYLLEAIGNRLSQDNHLIDITLPINDGKTLAWLHENAHIISRMDTEDEIHMQVSITEKHKAQLYKHHLNKDCI